MSHLKDFLQKYINAYHFVRKAFGVYKKHIFLLFVLGVVSSFFEAIGVNALIPLLSFFFKDSGTTVSTISLYIEKLFAFLHLELSLPVILIFISVVFVLKAAVLFGAGYVKTKIKIEYEDSTRSRLLKMTLRSSWPHLVSQKMGHLETLINVNVHQSSLLLTNIARLITAVSSLIVYFVVALNISQSITAMTLVLGALIFLASKPLLTQSRQNSRKISNVNKNVSHYVTESILGMKVIKAMGIEGRLENIGDKLFASISKLQMRSFVFQELPTVFTQPIGVVFVSLVVAFSYYNTSYSFGALIVIMYLIQRMFTYSQDIQSALTLINVRIPFVQDLVNYEDAARKNLEKTESTGSARFDFAQSLAFNDVSFSYAGGTKALDDIRFSILPGQVVGFIGGSGAGKTTVFDLILRLFNPSSGSILLDGKKIEDIEMSEWRKQVGYVSQDVFLVDDTIKNNIKFYEEISDEEVISAAKNAHIYEHIMGLPEGFETKVGDKGVLLSVGQRQRIAVARVLARKPSILLLDEATSALDKESEAHIKETIAELKGKTTVLIIAHRLSTILDSDQVYVLENGKIIEEGKPQELVKNKDTYLYRVNGIV